VQKNWLFCSPASGGTFLISTAIEILIGLKFAVTKVKVKPGSPWVVEHRQRVTIYCNTLNVYIPNGTTIFWRKKTHIKTVNEIIIWDIEL
jgi:hypothetical protein